jgi:hypothetical protein
VVNSSTPILVTGSVPYGIGFGTGLSLFLVGITIALSVKHLS